MGPAIVFFTRRKELWSKLNQRRKEFWLCANGRFKLCSGVQCDPHANAISIIKRKSMAFIFPVNNKNSTSAVCRFVFVCRNE